MLKSAAIVSGQPDTTMPSLWKFGGLTPLNLIKLTKEKIGQDELSTRSAALSYYFLLALFPMLLFLLSLVGVVAGPHSQMRESIVNGLGKLAPGSASQLIHRIVDQTLKASSGIKLAAGILGALWSASGGVSAIVTSLNVIYRTQETRSWIKQKVTVVGLTVALSLLIIVGIVLVLYGGKIGAAVAGHIGLGNLFRTLWDVVQYPVALAALLVSYSMIYYFGPDLEERKWHWVTPGAAAGVILWLAASFGFRVYLHFFNNYSATYGSIGAVIILMAWLYISGLAILIGGEINWVIENQDKERGALEAKKRSIQQQMKVA